MAYDSSSHGYVQRARARLDEGTQESLFYAAFELRSGIQSRLHQYIEVQGKLSKQSAKDYKFAKLSKRLEKAFTTGGKVVKITIYRESNDEYLCSYYHTPVGPSLREKGEKMGNYLHSLTQFRSDDDPWWETCRQQLEDTYAELVEANRGTLVGPPILDRKSGTITMSVEGEAGDSSDWKKQLGADLIVNERYSVQVDYLDKHPNSTLNL